MMCSKTRCSKSRLRTGQTIHASEKYILGVAPVTSSCLSILGVRAAGRLLTVSSATSGTKWVQTSWAPAVLSIQRRREMHTTRASGEYTPAKLLSFCAFQVHRTQRFSRNARLGPVPCMVLFQGVLRTSLPISQSSSHVLLHPIASYCTVVTRSIVGIIET